ncbi:Plasmodium exported protein (PHISTa), unknown, putative [Plasmodium sp. gorilla clade G3]|nr:Plasmodium exported protein (PHISTa), unknown, putative [Plasmodium sp. gorilla clade G3]
MMNKKKCSIFPWYSSDEKRKGKLYYISFKFICLCLYIIGFYHIFLDTSLENQTLEIVKNCNVYKRSLGESEKSNKRSKRKKNLKHKKEDVSKTKSNENNTKCNEQMVEGNKCSANIDHGNTNMENQRNSSTVNINYNDLSKNLTEKELFDLLNSFKVCPPKEDLRNIWNHTIDVAKGGFDDIQKELKALVQKYLDNDISHTFSSDKEEFVYATIWGENISRFNGTVATEVVEYTNKFFSLINGKHTLDDILKFIYSFLEHFKILKKELHEYHQKDLLQSIGKSLKKK